MRTRTKFLLLALAATVVGALATPTTSAVRLVSGETNFAVVFTPLTWDAFESRVSCRLTMAGTFHSRTITKVTNALIGFVNRAAISNCTNGTGTVLTATLPWHVRYRGFIGRLPNITGISVGIVGVATAITGPDLTQCLFRTDPTEPFVATINMAGGVATTMRADEIAAIDLEDDRFLCALAGDAFFSGSGNVTGATGESITIRLI